MHHGPLQEDIAEQRTDSPAAPIPSTTYVKQFLDRSSRERQSIQDDVRDWLASIPENQKPETFARAVHELTALSHDEAEQLRDVVRELFGHLPCQQQVSLKKAPAWKPMLSQHRAGRDSVDELKKYTIKTNLFPDDPHLGLPARALAHLSKRAAREYQSFLHYMVEKHRRHEIGDFVQAGLAREEVSDDGK